MNTDSDRNNSTAEPLVMDPKKMVSLTSNDGEKYYDLTHILEEADTSGKSVVTKLVCVSVVCIIFMAVEVLGGYLAKSLAIMTDAAHLFSDFSGFLLSIIAILIARRPATKALSYGYARAEVIGALASVVLIWGLTLWLVYEAIMKIVHPEEDVDGLIMFCTACFGLVCNLVMMKVLHSGHHHHGHSHGHDHGHGHSHGHSHGHGHGHHHHGHSHGHGRGHKHDHKHDHDHGHDSDKEKAKNDANSSYILYSEFPDQKNKVAPNDLNAPLIEKTHDHDHDHKHDHDHDHDHKHDHDHDHDHKHDHDHDHKDHDHDHKHDHKDHDHDHKHGHDHNHDHDHKHDHDHDHDHHHDHDHDHHHDHDHDLEGGKKKKVSKKDLENIKPRSLSAVHDHDNMNLRAALIHIIGDVIQSIGVIIAAGLIWWKPEWKIVDPICTFLFSIIVLFTTSGVASDCIKILLEGTPQELDLVEFEEGLQNVPGVVDIHDLHVWSLSAGKPAMSAHLLSTDIRKTLKHATRYVRQFGIYHSTIQVEEANTHGAPIKTACQHNLHN